MTPVLDPYPPQEPLGGRMFEYQAELLARGLGIRGEELSYGPSRLQRIELFRPERPNGLVLAAFPGGGWTNAYKEYLSHMAPAMTQAGVVLATIGYRLAPEHIFPVGLEDCAVGVNLLSRTLEDLGVDHHGIFLGGHSAGGHIAALLGVAGEAFGLLPGLVRGCLPISGIYDLTPAGGLSSRPRFLGSTGNEADASPLARIGREPPPMLISHADADFPHLINQATVFRKALEAAGADADSFVLEGADHFTGGYAGLPGTPWTQRSIAWMRSRPGLAGGRTSCS